MSISLSGGDIAFIAAFIVLPTFVLASCVWAIVAIRSGAVLPQHTLVAMQEDDAEAMTPEWPYVDEANVGPEADDVEASIPHETVTGTAEHTMITRAEPLAAESDTPDLPLVEQAGLADPLVTGDLAEPLALIQETGEFPVAHQDWSRPSAAEDTATDAPARDIAAEQRTPADLAAEPPADDAADKVESLDSVPKPTQESDPEAEAGSAASDTASGDDEEAAYDELFQHTTDLPPPPAIKRKPGRKAVAQLRPPVTTTGRARLRPAGARRPGEALDAAENELATEDERSVESDDGPVDVRPTNDE